MSAVLREPVYGKMAYRTAPRPLRQLRRQPRHLSTREVALAGFVREIDLVRDRYRHS
jgi:hypothetical protein